MSRIASTRKLSPEAALDWLTRTSSALPVPAAVRVTDTFCQALERVRVADEVSPTTAPPGVRSRSFSCSGLPTEDALAAFAQASEE